MIEKMRRIAVIDIGKTNAKVLSVDLETGKESILASRTNATLQGPPYPHFDTPALFDFIIRSLRQAGESGPVDAISVTTHGCAAALIDHDGALALPVLDYEHELPVATAADYTAIRPDFSETGSPRLPGGLNLGAQLFWQAHAFPEAFAQVKHVLTLPQYWSFRLTGVAASEATSLGCHSDLWNPWTNDFSSLVNQMGWRGLFPPVRPADTVLGELSPQVAAATGLPQETPVISGIHDSNASLLPWLAGEGPRAVLSTGTWMIVMSVRGQAVPLDARRDVLVNVNAHGGPTPTARFMAGREFDELTQGRAVTPSPANERSVLARQVMVMPSLHPDTGPFPGLRSEWTPVPPANDAERTAAAGFYAALMARECLDLIGAEGEIVVEGPFGGNSGFLRMLATATGRPVVAAGHGAGTGLGAAILSGAQMPPRCAPQPVLPEVDPLWISYAAVWRSTVSARWMAQR